MGELQVQSVGLSGGMPFIESDDPIPGLEVESVYIPGPRGLQYGGQFRGTWNMSSGTAGPAALPPTTMPRTPPTTVTPDATLTGVRFRSGRCNIRLDPYRLLPSGKCAGQPHRPQRRLRRYGLRNDAADQLSDNHPFESTICPGNSITPGIWFRRVSISASRICSDFVYNDGTPRQSALPSLRNRVGRPVAATITPRATCRYPSERPLIDAGCRIYPIRAGLHLMSGVAVYLGRCRVCAGSITVNFSDTSGGGTGIQRRAPR